MPSEIEKKYPRYWVSEGDEGTKNQFEGELLGELLKRFGREAKYSYTKVLSLNAGRKLVESMSNLMVNQLNVIVYNFVDMLSHARTEMEVIRELVGDEAAYRSITLSWFMHSPLIEVIKADGNRVTCKHKRDDFRETATPRKVGAPLEVLAEANAIAVEWVTTTRLQHVLDKMPSHNISNLGKIIAAMTEDVMREGKNEIVDSKEARKAISKRTVELYKEYIKGK